MDSKYKDAYEQLELESCGTSWEEVRNSYRRKVQRLHPDRVQPSDSAAANQDAFIRVTRAYKLLNSYHRKNHDLPRERTEQHDNNPQDEIGAFEKTTYKDLTGVVESVQYHTAQGPTILKIVLVSIALTLISAAAIMSYASWQKSQVPPVTPFTSEKPLPLSTETPNLDQ